MSVSGPFARLPAPPHVGDVSSSAVSVCFFFLCSFYLSYFSLIINFLFVYCVSVCINCVITSCW